MTFNKLYDLLFEKDIDVFCENTTEKMRIYFESPIYTGSYGGTTMYGFNYI